MISFSEAATNLEAMCLEIDTAEELTAAIQALFKESVQDLEKSVDRRISYIKYAESQIASAKESANQWVRRQRHFESMLEKIKQNTVEVIKANPGVPYNGSLGALKVQKNPAPSLIIEEGDLEKFPSQYLRTIQTLNRDAVKIDLMSGIEVDGAKLQWGEHLRIGLK